MVQSPTRCVPSSNEETPTNPKHAAETNRNQKAQMPHHAACRPSTLHHMHLSSPARLTLVFASTSAPAARSCSTTAARPFIAARNSGVSPACGARQRSIRHPLSPRKCVCPTPHPRPYLLPNLDRGEQTWSETTDLPRNHDATKSWRRIGKVSS